MPSIAMLAPGREGDPRARILSAALLVFAERGFDAATLKEITETAGANIAAVNYYFRSKDELIRVVLETFLRPVNEARLQALEAWEREVDGGRPDLDRLADAVVRPMVQLSRDERGGRALIRLLLQVRALPRPMTTAVVAEQFDPVHGPFIAAFRRCVPELSHEEVVCRYEFARGAMMHVLADLDPGTRRLASLAGGPLEINDETVIRQLVTFIVAGFRALPTGKPRLARRRPADKPKRGGTKRK